MKYLYEFIGTFFLVLTVGMTVMEPSSAGMFAPIAIGSALAVMIYAGAHISGGHLNPAVSLSVFLRGKLSHKDLWCYWFAQLAAGVAAAYVTVFFKGYPMRPPMDLNIGKAFFAEAIFTFALCYIVLNALTSRDTKGNSYYGWAIGFTVLFGGYAVGMISGAAFNPAVALGISILQFTSWPDIWIFFVANFVGGAVAALVFKCAEKRTRA